MIQEIENIELEREERIRIFRIYCGGWITLSRIVRYDDGEIDNVNYLVAYSYSNYDEEQRDAIVVIRSGNIPILIEYIIDGDFIVTARIDEKRICEFPGVIETVIRK